MTDFVTVQAGSLSEPHPPTLQFNFLPISTKRWIFFGTYLYGNVEAEDY